MLIKTITVENFLPFQGKQRIEFSTDKDHNVTLIMGNNGAGKTSLAQAFEWCLYGKAPKETNQVINAFVRDHIAPGACRYASVEIEIEKDDKTYSVSRRQKYSRKDNGRLDKPAQHEFSILYKENGETRQVAAGDRGSTINRLLSNQLSHYFFFDGEHVKNMRKEIEQGKSSDFADAVKTILGLQPIASALDHLKAPGNRLSVDRWFNRQLDVAGNADLEEKKKRIETLGKTIERESNDLELAEVDEDVAKENVAECQRLLRENEESEKAQKDVEKTQALLKQANIAVTARRNELFRLFRDCQYRFFTQRPILDAQEELADEDKISKGVPSVDDKTIRFILERGECICGTKFEAGSDVAKHLYELLDYVPPKDLGTYIAEFDKDCRVRTEGSFNFIDDLAEAYRKYCAACNSVKTAEQAVEKAVAFLEGLNNVDIGILRKNLRNAEADRSKAAGRVATARRAIANAKNERERLQSEIKAYSVKNAKNQEIMLCLSYVDYIYDYLNAYYKTHEASTRAQLRETVNKFFTAMYEGELHLSLDDNYGVAVTVDDVDTSGETWKTSSGQTLAIILAFILGILDIAKSQSKEEDDLLKGDTYPLVMDAPLSDFDKTRIGTICNLLPSVAEQVIIIIKDTDGELAEEHMKDRIGRRYSIERLHDYDSVVKE